MRSETIWRITRSHSSGGVRTAGRMAPREDAGGDASGGQQQFLHKVSTGLRDNFLPLKVKVITTG